VIKRAILSSCLFVALGAAALLMANAGSKHVEHPSQVGAVEAQLQLRAASR
jgi:hypothetical protein